MDCAIAIFGGKGLISYLYFLLFTVTVTFLVVLSRSLLDSKREIRQLREKIEDLERRGNL